MLKKGVPKSSIVGPLLFNIFLNDLFLLTGKLKIQNYADDNTPHSTEKNLNDLLDTLQNETTTILKWFPINEMKSNIDKYHLIVTSQEPFYVILGEVIIPSCTSVNLLGVSIDNKLSFTDHVSKLC